LNKLPIWLSCLLSV